MGPVRGIRDSEGLKFLDEGVGDSIRIGHGPAIRGSANVTRLAGIHQSRSPVFERGRDMKHCHLERYEGPFILLGEG